MANYGTVEELARSLDYAADALERDALPPITVAKFLRQQAECARAYVAGMKQIDEKFAAPEAKGKEPND